MSRYMSEKEILFQFVQETDLKGDWSFEVLVGTPPSPESNSFEARAHQYRHKKIDAVLHTPEGVTWIFEAKRRLNSKALGQLLCYKELYKNVGGGDSEVNLGIVCQIGDPILAPIMKKYGVSIFLV